MTAKQHRKPGQRGFVLVLTLWVLAAIAIAAAYFGERVQASLRLATARQDLAQAQIILNNGRAEVLYRLATSPMSAYGLGDPPDVVRLDDRFYSESDGLVQMQDVGGLVDLNTASDELMMRLLVGLGVPGDTSLTLVDTLRDYVDADDLRRLNGAESAQYRAIGRPDLPRNEALQSPQELRDVYGWAQQPSLWDSGKLLELTTTDGTARLNPNTAPLGVLTVLPGVTPEAARLIVEHREAEPITPAWMDRMLGTRFNTLPSPLRNFPFTAVRVTQRVPGLPWALRYNVELTPKGSATPWKITYFYRLEDLRPDPGPDKNAAAPTASSSSTPVHASDPPRFPPRAAQPSSAPRLLAP